MGQTLEARFGERTNSPNQIQQLNAATQLLKNMGYFLYPLPPNQENDGSNKDNVTLETGLLTPQQYSKIPYRSVLGEELPRFTIRFKAVDTIDTNSDLSIKHFKYTVVDILNNQIRAASFGSVLNDGRQILKILKGHIHLAMQADLNFVQDEKTNFVTLQLPESRFDSRAVILGRRRVIGLEFQPQIPSNRDISSTQHGKVGLLYLP